MIAARPRRRGLHRRQHRHPGAAQQPAPASRSRSARQLTKGLGAGANPEVGRQAALEDTRRDRRRARGRRHGVRHRRAWAAAPAPARAPDHRRHRAAARRAHGRRGDQALPLRGQASGASRPSTGMAELKAAVDTLITIPNQRLLAVADETTPLLDDLQARRRGAAQRGAGHLATSSPYHGLINVDFADVQHHHERHGHGADGHRPRHGRASARSIAAQQAISIAAARGRADRRRHGLLINITGGRDMTLHEVNEALLADPGRRARGREHHLRQRHRRRAWATR